MHLAKRLHGKSAARVEALGPCSAPHEPSDRLRASEMDESYSHGAAPRPDGRVLPRTCASQPPPSWPHCPQRLNLWRSGGLWRGVVAAALIVVLLFLPAMAEPSAPSEYQVKAAFLFNFPKYIEWPKDVLAEEGQPLVLGVMGQDRFGADLRAIVASKLVEGRPVILKSPVSNQEARTCHLLFISDSERKKLPEILSDLKSLPVVTVGESPGFLEHGGTINFVIRDSKVRLDINLAGAEKAGLKISAKLLGVADTVKRE